MKYSTPSLSVVVATYNRPKTLQRLLGLLNDQRCVDFRLIDVCVVDDGSSSQFAVNQDGYRFSFEYIYRERHPQNISRVYSSRNLAAARTHGEYILQLDDDVEFHPYLLNMLQSMAGMSVDTHWLWTPRISNNTTHDSAGLPNHGHDASCNWDFGADGRWWDGRVSWHETHWGCTDSSGMFMPRRTWEAVGGYDEQLDGCMGAADQELALRVQKLGERPGDVKVYIGPYFVNKADEETGSWRDKMIERRVRPERNEDVFNRKHPDAKLWTEV